MPTITIPLVGEETRRGLGRNASTTTDQFFGGCVFTRMSNNATKSSSWYLNKRPGFTQNNIISAGVVGTAVFNSISLSGQHELSAFGGTNSTIFQGTTNAGTITGLCFFITETQINGVAYWMISSGDGTGWYLVNGATTVTAYTADGNNSTTITDIKIAGVNNTAGLYSGQLLAAASNIVAGTRVVSVDAAAFTAVLDTATTGGAFNDLAITKTPIAKIIDADFPSIRGRFAFLDGYTFVITSTGRIYNSDLNSVTSWGASNFITADIFPDDGLDIIGYKSKIIAFGSASIEYFYNAGNPSGSVLSPNKELASRVGLFRNTNTDPRPMLSLCDDNLFFVGSDLCLYLLGIGEKKPLTDFGMSLGTSTAFPKNCFAFRIGEDTIVQIDDTGNDLIWYSLATNTWIEPNFAKVGMAFSNIAIHIAFTTPSVALGVSSSGVGTPSGATYLLRTDIYQDDGVAFTMAAQTEPKVLNKGRGFVINSVELLADNQSSGSTTLEISRDDYASFQTLGSFDLTQRRKRIVRGGLCRNHAIFRVTDSGNNAWRGQALIVDYTPCAT